MRRYIFPTCCKHLRDLNEVFCEEIQEGAGGGRIFTVAERLQNVQNGRMNSHVQQLLAPFGWVEAVNPT